MGHTTAEVRGHGGERRLPLLQERGARATEVLLVPAAAELQLLLDDLLPLLPVLPRARLHLRQVLRLVRLPVFYCVLPEQPVRHHLQPCSQCALRLLDLRLHSVAAPTEARYRGAKWCLFLHFPDEMQSFAKTRSGPNEM
jgi:hypothetical protein